MSASMYRDTCPECKRLTLHISSIAQTGDGNEECSACGYAKLTGRRPPTAADRAAHKQANASRPLTARMLAALATRPVDVVTQRAESNKKHRQAKRGAAKAAKGMAA